MLLAFKSETAAETRAAGSTVTPAVFTPAAAKTASETRATEAGATEAGSTEAGPTEPAEKSTRHLSFPFHIGPSSSLIPLTQAMSIKLMVDCGEPGGACQHVEHESIGR